MRETMSDEILTVEVESGTRRRLEMLGFPHDLTGREVVRFLIEEGLSVLGEKPDAPRSATEIKTLLQPTPPRRCPYAGL